jgi:serine/threonine protein kinase
MSQLPPDSQFGNYQIVRHIAGGGMAQIYLAKVRGLAGFEKMLALKVINAEYADEQRFIQMLIDEAKITVGLSHVNIAQVFDLGHVNGIYYIAMEFVDGIDVLELVNGLHALGEKVPVEAVAMIGRQMCSGLHYAHTRKDKQGTRLNIVHRDISPQNILVSRAGEVKVVDFGIAKAAGMSTKTQAGVIKGKVHYMAPEQAMGKKADSRCDIFSAGIVLWEMLTAQMVYSGDNVRELVERVRLADIRRPSSIRAEVDSTLDRLVMQALARKPEDRFQTAHAFQVELTKYLSSSCPDYGASNLAQLVERVRGEEPPPPSPAEESEEHLVKEDMIQDLHSVIAEAVLVDEPLDRDRLILDYDQGHQAKVLEDELVIGRAGELPVPDARVSRRHARISRDSDGALTVEDLGSANGTYVNDLKLSGPCRLKDKDVIRIGSFSMVFRAAQQVDASAQAAPITPCLVISCGASTTEQTLDSDYTISYQVKVGPASLVGVAGRVTRREGSVWLEPLSGREPMSIKGDEVTAPVRLAPGDTFTVGAFAFELRQE